MERRLGVLARTLAILHLLVLVVWRKPLVVCDQEKTTPMIVFGDSLVDQGNNNYLFSIAKCNFRPYGIDFPLGATGRFCNGRLISDFLSEMMDEQPILAYLNQETRRKDLLRGTNFASAGCGILEETGSVFLSRLTIPKQLQMFKEYQNVLRQLIGEPNTSEFIRNAIYNINIGSNDWVNNYALRNVTSKYGTPQEFNILLISTYRKHLMKLYKMGARKVVVTGIGPLGCAPSVLNRYNPPIGHCVGFLQDYAKLFNSKLKEMLSSLNKDLPGSTFVYANAFDIFMEFLKHPQSYGFEVVNEGCCGQGKYNGYLICTRLSSYCKDRRKYLFWDAFHPTEATNGLVARRVFSGPPSDISPMNVQQLIALRI